jgi:hypothetical protein
LETVRGSTPHANDPSDWSPFFSSTTFQKFPGVYDLLYVVSSGPGNVVGTATGYELDGPGIESRWGDEIFRTCPDRPWVPPSLLYSGYRVFPGGKERPGRDADPSPPSCAVIKKGWSYTSTPPTLHATT